MAESGPAIGQSDYRPRETRSISALTMRSTNPGRLSSSQDFSIGRSISLTRSSSVRALLLSTVWASVLKALSTADTVERDSICGCGAALSTGGGWTPACLGCLGKFEIVLRFDLLERWLRRRRCHHRHLVGELEYLGFGQGRRPDLVGRCRLIEAVQQGVNVVLAVGRGWRGGGGGRGRGGRRVWGGGRGGR